LDNLDCFSEINREIMPELPEVEVFRQRFNSSALNQKVARVEVLDDIILENISSRAFQMKLKGATFQATHRHGKNLFVQLDTEETMMLHFGMSGSLKYGKDGEEEPEYSRIIFNLNNGYNLYYVSPRKLGRIGVVEDEADYIVENKLGPDTYSDDFTWDVFKNIMKGRRGIIKSSLMNQKLMAGIGNVYSDEILFHSNIYPFTVVHEINDKELKTIFDNIKMVFEKVINTKLKGKKFPKNFLVLKRSEGAECPICGGRIKREKFSGRSSYYCEAHQKKNLGPN
jgi:formamidopyrimidine-DNA glycosylase